MRKCSFLRLEGWKGGRVEGWKGGRVGEWKIDQDFQDLIRIRGEWGKMEAGRVEEGKTILSE